jgi:hypothetical protein
MARHGLAETLAQRRELEQRHRELARGRVFGAAAFAPIAGGSRSDAVELEKTYREIARLGDRSRSQLMAAAADCPPLGIALGVAALRGRFLREPIGVGNRVPKDFRDHAHSLFDQIAATWAPGCEDEVIVERLSDPVSVHNLASLPMPELTESDALGYAPIDLETLLRLSARALAPQLDVLTRAVHKEDSEWRAAAEAARKARKATSLFDGGTETTAQLLSASERQERYEAMNAVETMFEAIDTATDAFPPFKLRSALRPLLAEPKLPETARETLVDAHTGSLTTIPTLFARAVVGRALARVVDVMEEVFPGLLGLASGDPSDADLAALSRHAGSGARSPFREAHDASGSEEQSPVTTEDALFDAMDRSGVFRLLDQAVSHCAALGRLRIVEARARARVKVVDKVNVFTRSREQEIEASLASRREWHSETLRTISWTISSFVHQNGSGFPALDLYLHIRRVHEATHRLVPQLVGDPHGFGPGLTGEPPLAEVFGIVPLTTELHQLGAAVGRIAGLAGTKLELAHRVAAVMQSGEPLYPFPSDGRRLHPDQVVRSVAHVLRERAGDAFPKLLAHYGRLVRMFEDSSTRSESAARAVHWFDKLNVFTDSPEERERDLSADLARRQLSEAREAFTTIHRQLDAGLAGYPPGLVFFGLSDVTVRAQMIQAVAERVSGGRNNYWRAVLVGREPFLAALCAWTAVTLQVFGGALSPGQILERYALRRL